MKIGPRTRVGAPCRRGSLAPGFPPPESLLRLERGKVRKTETFSHKYLNFHQNIISESLTKEKKPTCRLIGRFCPRVPELRLPQGLKPNFVRFEGREFYFSIRIFKFQSRLDQRCCRQNKIKCEFCVSDYYN